MKRFYRLLLAWLLAFALPLQGYAATHMLLCSAGVGAGAHHTAAAGSATSAQHAPPCHGDAAQASAEPASQHDAGKHDPTKHDTAKPGSCAACIAAAPMAAGGLLPLAVDGPVTTAIPFRTRRLPSVDPSLPDRPPRFNAA